MPWFQDSQTPGFILIPSSILIYEPILMKFSIYNNQIKFDLKGHKRSFLSYIAQILILSLFFYWDGAER
jgi:hypothetical protein